MRKVLAPVIVAALAAMTVLPPPTAHAAVPTTNVFPIVGVRSCVDNFHPEEPDGHEGTDCFADLGTPLVAVESGSVFRAERATGGWDCATQTGDRSGNTVSILGASGTRYYYGHLDVIDSWVQDGVPVTKGQRIGTVGETGNAICSVPHLHFQIWDGNVTLVNPFPHLMAWPMPGTPPPPGPPTPTGTITGLSGANGTGTIHGTVDLPTHVGAIGIRALVSGAAQTPTQSASGSGNRAFTAPFTAPVTAAHPICVQAWNGAIWTTIGCRNTAQGHLTTLGGANAAGTASGLVRIQGWTGQIGVRLVVNDVVQPTTVVSGGTGDRPFTATFARQGTGSQRVCAQGNSFGYWHPTGGCWSTATGTFSSMSGTSGPGNALGSVSAPGWSQGIMVRATVDGAAQPFTYSNPTTRTYSTPFSVPAGTHQVCVQANTYGYWTTLGCKSRTG